MGIKKYDFDYIIIGGGPAGITAALNLAKRQPKKRIALIESVSLGGNDLSARDIPYLVNLDFAHHFFKLKNRPEFSQQTLHYNLPTLISNQTRISATLIAEQKKSLESSGITIINGHAYLTDPHTVSVGSQPYTAETFILATGTKLKTGNIAGLEITDYYAPESVVKLRNLPKNALVVGGGATGCEIAAYLAELGVKVVLIEREKHLLPQEDSDVGDYLASYFTKVLGILVVTGAEVTALEPSGSEKRAIISINQQEKSLRVEQIILATGATPYLDYGLDNAKVKYQTAGIYANRLFQTSAKNIYAIGDCLGYEHSSTERAEYQASVLASNLSKGTKNYITYDGFIRRVNTYPAVAIVGRTEAKLKKAKYKYVTSTVYLKDLPYSKITNSEYGFVKLIAERSGRVLGGVIVAPDADLAATELSLAFRNRLTTLDLASAPHIANSYNVAIKIAAKELLKRK